MKSILSILFATTLGTLFFQGKAAAAPQGIVAVKSSFSVSETAQRLETAIGKRGFTLFAHIDHAAGAASVGLSLRPTQLFIFGNPKGGTPLMQCRQSIAIDLPLKALIWADEMGQVWFGYNDPQYLQQRHGIVGCDKELANVTKVLQALGQEVTHAETKKN